MSNLNKFYLSAVLTFAGIGMFFLVNHYLEKNTDTTILLNPGASDSTIKAEIASRGKALASVPVGFNLEKHLNRQTGAQGKLMISSDATSVPFPENEGDPYRWSPLDGYIIEGTVDSIARNTDSKSYGVSLKNDLGRFIYRENQARAGAVAFFNNCEGVHRFSCSAKDENEWTIEEVPYHDVVCASAGSTYPIHASGGGYPRRSRQINHSTKTIAHSNQLNASGHFESKAGAPTVIYCNFEGEVVNQPDWSESIINAAPSGLSNEAVLEILKLVAEDFAPFDVNVTNDRSVYDSTPTYKRVMCISTPTDTASPGAGGIAYLNTFRDDLVCWDFNLDGDTISHEVGHTLNLDHHGDSSQDEPEYHDGHSSESRDWGPIMGSAGVAKMVQWSDGNYTSATNKNQDDLEIITNYGLSYRTDDYGNDSATGENISISNMPVTRYGIIERSTDIDVFNVTYSSLGKVQIAGTGTEGAQSNLDVKMSILDSEEIIVYEQTSDSTEEALTELILEPGTYQVSIQGDSSGNPYGDTATGWSSYGSLGQYQLSFFPDPLFSDAIEQYSPVNMTGDADWIAQIKNTYDGEDAAESGSISGDQSSNFSISERTTSVSFWYKVSSENNYDFFEFYIDGSREIRKSGEVGWTQFTDGSLSNTNHTFEWRYAKDAYVIEGADRAWVDQISFDQNGGYQEWSNTNSASDSGEVDSDGDGLIDLVEYLVAGSSLSQDGTDSIALDANSREFTLRRDSASTDLIIRLLVSDDLENWAPIAVSYEGNSFSTINGLTATDNALNGSLVETRITISPTNETKKFAKLEIVLK
tara:strand:+ start:79 stop:2514 length:2436 start_codon:yes stop_codon:yes gene_type:complete